MSKHPEERVATLELCAGCLQEAAERLHRLCPRLHNREHEDECSETARNIVAQVLVLHDEIALLKEGA